MTLDVETVVAVSLMMAVFSAVAAVGTSIVLGAGFERLRCGFEIVRKQTGFFSDAIHKLEQKVETVDKQASDFSHSIHTLENKVLNVGEQAGAFISSIQKLEQKVEIVDKQTGFFSDALYRLEQKIEAVKVPEAQVSQETGLISADGKDAESSEQSLLVDMVSLTASLEDYTNPDVTYLETHFQAPVAADPKEIRFH